MLDVMTSECATAATERSGAANVVRIVLCDSLKRAGLAEFTLVVGRAISVRVDSRAGENPLSIAQLWPMGGTGPSDGEMFGSDCAATPNKPK